LIEVRVRQHDRSSVSTSWPSVRLRTKPSAAMALEQAALEPATVAREVRSQVLGSSHRPGTTDHLELDHASGICTRCAMPWRGSVSCGHALPADAQELRASMQRQQTLRRLVVIKDGWAHRCTALLMMFVAQLPRPDVSACLGEVERRRRAHPRIAPTRDELDEAVRELEDELGFEEEHADAVLGARRLRPR